MDSTEKLAQAIERLRLGDLDTAGRGLGEILDADPDNAEALHYAGVLSHYRGDSNGAAAMIRRSLEIDPGQVGAHNNLGNILRALGQNRDAIEAYFEALKLDPHHSDSWCNVGVLMRNLGNLEHAVEALAHAVEFNPGHAESWHNLGINLANLGRIEEAAAALQKCAETAGDSRWYPPGMHAYILAALGQNAAAEAILTRYLAKDPSHETANHMLAALRGEPLARASEAYVRVHFDGFADGFDAILKTLDYRAPELVTEQVRKLMGDGPPFAEAIDLGCGTGLCGALIRPLCGRLTGVDLSRGMLKRAARREVYDRLAEADLCSFLEDWPAGGCDLAVCVDTLCYIGVLEPVFAGLRHALRPAAHFVATVEAHDGDEPDYRLTISGRYSHAAGYIRAAAADAGLAVTGMDAAVLRKEMGQPVNGLVFTLTRE
jgi:predicted TPR repeat methyltransferase